MVYDFRSAWLHVLTLLTLTGFTPQILTAQLSPQFSRTAPAGVIQIKNIQEDQWQLNLSRSDYELNRVDPEIQKVQEEKTRLKFSQGIIKMKSNGAPLNFRFDTPEVKKNFSGINSAAIPFDNGTAISNGKFVVHSVNSSIIIKDTSGSVLFSGSLSAFFGVSTTISDPRVIYDSYADRFIVLAIPTTECKVYIAFSASNDPTGSWYKYIQTIPGEISNYIYDYPYAGITEHELIISGSVFPPSGSGAVHPHILQIAKREAYAGATLRVNNYKLPTTSSYSLCVVNHGSPDMPYGPQSYLVSDIRSSAGASEITLYTITDTIGKNPQLQNEQFQVNHYSPSGYAGQKGSSSVLTTIDTRIMNAIYANGTIHLVHHGDIDNSGFSSIIYYRLQPDSAIIKAFPFTKTSSDVCFPSLSLFSKSPREDKTVLIAFQESSTNIFPSLSAIICNDDGSWSQPIVVKEGSGNIRNFRWGDYSSCTRRHNAPEPSAWISGEYGASGNTRSCWIAEISAKAILLTPPDVLIKTPYLLYPNPAAERFMIKMNLPVEEFINVSMYDVLGQLVKVLHDGPLPAGENELSFNRAALAAGTYIIRLSAGGKVQYTHKLLQY